MKFIIIKYSYIIAFIMLILISQSCKKERIDKVSGIVQKGPFVNGTIVTLTELDEDFKPTGKKFSSEIIDDEGSFSIPDITLKSPYAILSADGYYYDEVKGQLSAGRIMLNAIVDVTEVSTVNINILSHLEKTRVEYLIENGLDFFSAKRQAQQEILKIFNFDQSTTSNSENLDISQAGDDNAKLLAISAILQGTHTSAQLSELLSNINTDMRDDGILNSTIKLLYIFYKIKFLLATISQVNMGLEQGFKILNQVIDFRKKILDNSHAHSENRDA